MSAEPEGIDGVERGGARHEPAEMRLLALEKAVEAAAAVFDQIEDLGGSGYYIPHAATPNVLAFQSYKQAAELAQGLTP